MDGGRSAGRDSQGRSFRYPERIQQAGVGIGLRGRRRIVGQRRAQVAEASMVRFIARARTRIRGM
jgi:hypothetical protein